MPGAMENEKEKEKRVAVMLDLSLQVKLPPPLATPEYGRSRAQLIIVDQEQPLAAIIKESLCPGWKLENPEDFSLQFQEPNRQFITERNRTEIQNGSILTLTFSPVKTAQAILDGLNSQSGEEKISALKQLSELSMDITFANEYITKKGLLLLTNMVQGGSNSIEAQPYVLKSFVELMYHNIVSWDLLEVRFIKTVANCVSTTRSTQADATTLQSALEILESIVLNSASKYELVEQEITPENLSQHLNSSNVDIQKNSLALMNALFMKGDLAKRKKIAEHLRSKRSQSETLRRVIRPDQSQNPEMSHQLYALQTHLFSLLQEKMNTPVEENSSTVLKDITELRKIAFDSDPEPATVSRKQNHTNEFRKLGFQNHVNPAKDFLKTPPGVLALDNMLFFAKMHGENYTKVVLENSSRADDHDLPFARASIELTALLCDILKVGEQPTEDGQTYYPMFFFHERPFEELYCHVIQLMNKTWKEMKATTLDFPKVLAVVKEQIQWGMESRPQSFDMFRTKLSQLTYGDINKIREQQRKHKEEWESQARPIVELREQLEPEIRELVKQQRLNFLVEGTMFTNKIGRMRDKKRYCRLSPNHKVFYYGDMEDQNIIPSIEQLPNKLAVVDITGLLTGKTCPHIKDLRRDKQALHKLAFSIETEQDMGEPLNFIAPSEKYFELWTDGINALLGNVMDSELAKKELETLLRMEVKLRLLDLEGEDIKIPDSPPPIPKEPADFDFAYKSH